MGNQFLNLAVPAGNGVGAATDTSMLGRKKTITVQGTFEATVNIEIAEAAITGPFAQIATFANTGKKTISFAAQAMRVRITGYKNGTPGIGIGSDEAGGQFATLTSPAGNGVGPSQAVNDFGTFNTVVVGGPFGGVVLVEISTDNVEWAQCFSFSGPDVQSKCFIAQYMRVRRAGVPVVNPGLPNVSVGAINDSSGGLEGITEPRICFVYQPGGTSSENVYTDWDTLVAAMANVDGCIDLLFDDTFTSPIPIPVGGPYDMTRVRWMGAFGRPQVAVTIPDGVTFTKLRQFSDNLLIVYTGAGSPAPIEDVVANDVIVFERVAQAVCRGTGPLIRSTLGAPDQLIIVLVDGGAILRGSSSGTNEVIDNSVLGGVLFFAMISQSSIEADSLVAIAGSLVGVQLIEDSAIYDPVQTGLAAATVITLNSARTRWDPVTPGAVTPVTLVPNTLQPYIGAVAQPLPALSTMVNGETVILSNVGAAAVTAVPAGADLINLVAAPHPVPIGGAVIFVANPPGGTWYTIP